MKHHHLHKLRAPFIRQLLVLAMVASYVVLIPHAHAAVFSQPNVGNSKGIWDSIMAIVQYVAYAFYILAFIWSLQGAKDIKEGDQKSAWQKWLGALCIFLAAPGIQLLRTLTSGINTGFE